MPSSDSKPSIIGSIITTQICWKSKESPDLMAGSESADEKSMAVTEEGETYSEWLELRSLERDVLVGASFKMTFTQS